MDSYDDRTPIQNLEHQKDTVRPVSRRQPSKFYIICILIHVLVLSILIILGVWMSRYFMPKSGFEWGDITSRSKFHPLMMALGFLFLSTEAVLSFRIGRNYDKTVIKIAHVLLHTINLAMAAVAITAIVTFKIDRKMPLANMYTLHSWIGALTLGSYVLQYVFGGIFFLLPQSMMPLYMRERFLPFHRFFGAAAYLTAMVAVLTGIFDHLLLFYYSALGPAPRMGNTAAILVIVVGVLCGYLLVDRIYQRQPAEELPYHPGVF